MPLTPTQRAYAAVNCSASACKQLAEAHKLKGRAGFSRALEEECKFFSYYPHISMGSLRSNLFRYGNWKKHMESKNVDLAFNRIDGNMNYRREIDEIYSDPSTGLYKRRAKLALLIKAWLKDIGIDLQLGDRNILKRKLEKEGNWKHYKKDIERLYNEEKRLKEHSLNMTPSPIQIVHDEQQWPEETFKHIDPASVETRLLAMMAQEGDIMDFGPAIDKLLKYKVPKENTDMCKVEIKKQTLINGNPVDEMGDSDLIHWITNLEDTIEKRKKIKTKSVKITNDIAKMEAQCVELAALLDERDNGD